MGHKYNKTSSTSPRRTSLCRSRQHKRPIRPRERCLLKTIKSRHSYNITMVGMSPEQWDKLVKDLEFNHKVDMWLTRFMVAGCIAVLIYFGV